MFYLYFKIYFKIYFLKQNVSTWPISWVALATTTSTCSKEVHTLHPKLIWYVLELNIEPSSTWAFARLHYTILRQIILTLPPVPDYSVPKVIGWRKSHLLFYHWWCLALNSRVNRCRARPWESWLLVIGYWNGFEWMVFAWAAVNFDETGSDQQNIWLAEYLISRISD